MSQTHTHTHKKNNNYLYIPRPHEKETTVGDANAKNKTGFAPSNPIQPPERKLVTYCSSYGTQKKQAELLNELL